MKKTVYLLSGFFIILAVGILIPGCQKNSSNIVSEKEQLEMKVNNWLSNGQLKNSAARKERVEAIRKNLDFSAVSTEFLNENNDALIIPLNIAFIPRVNNTDNPVNSLLLIMDKQGNINMGILVQFIPANKNNRFLSANTVSKVINDKGINVDGKFVFLSIFDRFLHEKKYENGSLSAYKEMQSKNKPIINARVEEEICIDWYLITTIYYINGTTETTEEYIGTTCYEGCQPNELCDELEGGTGGGQSEFDLAAESALMAEVFSAETRPQTVSVNYSSPTLTGVPISWEVVKNSFNLWQVTSSDIVMGYNSTNTGAVISYTQHTGSAISGQTSWNRIPTNPGGPVIPLISLSWQETSNSSSTAADYKSATITVSGKVKNFGFTSSSHSNWCTVSVQ